MAIRVDDEVAALIVDGLRRVGIRAEVDSEPVRKTKLYRFFVVSEKFKRMSYSERQKVVWRIVERALSEAKLERISMIVTLTPDEYVDAD
jgi:acid stress-induced BolA-like protein IbaG/YrbA